MKSKKWKIVRLKNPKLIKIRANLRKLLAAAIHAEIKRLGKNSINSQRKNTALSKKKNELLYAWGKSLLKCSYGPCMTFKKKQTDTLNEDMVWNPLQKHWICINCYNHHFKTDKQKEFLRKVVEKTASENKAYEEWFAKNS